MRCFTVNLQKHNSLFQFCVVAISQNSNTHHLLHDIRSEISHLTGCFACSVYKNCRKYNTVRTRPDNASSLLDFQISLTRQSTKTQPIFPLELKERKQTTRKHFDKDAQPQTSDTFRRVTSTVRSRQRVLQPELADYKGLQSQRCKRQTGTDTDTHLF